MKKFIKIFMVITMMIMSLSSIPFSVSASENNNATRYISYNCETGEQTVIEITPDDSGVFSFEDSSNDNNDSQVSTCNVIGSDDRMPVTNPSISPYNGIGYINCTLNGETSRGTCAAFADNAVITAAHVLWGCDSINDVTINIYFGRNGTVCDKAVTYDPIRIIIPEEYIENASSEYDYAIILYAENSNENISNYFFGFSKNVTTSTNVTLTGYPRDTTTSDDSQASSNSKILWTHSGRVTNVYTRTIRYQIDATGGQSGAPVYTSDNKIVAIHQGSITNYNVGKRLDNDLFTIMKNIRENNYEYLL